LHRAKSVRILQLRGRFLEGGIVYYANALTFGLKDDELVYIEALAVVTE